MARAVRALPRFEEPKPSLRTRRAAGLTASRALSAILVLEKLTDDYEVIVVNDGSHDYTGEILDELDRQYDRVRVVHHEKNKGYGGALRSGFSEASKEFVFYTDGDAPY